MLLCCSLDPTERQQARLLELVRPTLLDLVDRNGVQVVQLLPPATHRRHEVGGLEHREVLRGALAGHREVTTQLAERQGVAFVQAVQEVPPGGIGERLEDLVVRCDHTAHHAGKYLPIAPWQEVRTAR